MKRYKKGEGFVLYAYVLMTNSAHLLIETPNVSVLNARRI
jgi:hypothetical protein